MDKDTNGKKRNKIKTNNEIRNYIFQFLMVFLGVSAGFIVENIRENYVENKRAEQYASSLITDLKEDTLNLRQAISRSLITAHDIDTLISMLSQKNISKIPAGKIYYFGAKSLLYHNFIPNKSTMNQLISTGSLQYFKNYSIQKSIADYNQDLNVLNYQQETENQTYPEKIKFIETIFEGNALSQVIYKNPDEKINNNFFSKDIKLMTYDKKLLNEFINFCYFRKQFLLIKANDMYPRPLKSAVKLINELEKEYKD